MNIKYDIEDVLDFFPQFALEDHEPSCIEELIPDRYMQRFSFREINYVDLPLREVKRIKRKIFQRKKKLLVPIKKNQNILLNLRDEGDFPRMIIRRSKDQAQRIWNKLQVVLWFGKMSGEQHKHELHWDPTHRIQRLRRVECFKDGENSYNLRFWYGPKF